MNSEVTQILENCSKKQKRELLRTKDSIHEIMSTKFSDSRSVVRTGSRIRGFSSNKRGKDLNKTTHDNLRREYSCIKTIVNEREKSKSLGVFASIKKKKLFLSGKIIVLKNGLKVILLVKKLFNNFIETF